jgi:hypothetical protein
MRVRCGGVGWAFGMALLCGVGLGACGLFDGDDGGTVDDGGTGADDGGPAGPILGAPAPHVVHAAVAFTPLTGYFRGNYYTNTFNSGGHTFILAFAARAGDTSVDDRLLEQIRHILTAEHGICANGGFPAQHELQATGMLSIASRTPRIWDALTADERARADATMKASLISGAFTTSDNNPLLQGDNFQHTLDGDGNVSREFNPHFREGMVGSVLIAATHFGLEETMAILEGYDHLAFVQELDDLGLDHAHETFTWRATNPDSDAPTGAQIEEAVHDWSLRGVTLDDPMQLYADLTAHTYGGTVQCGLNDGQGIEDGDAPEGVAGVIASGCEGLPNQGLPGMLMEFDSGDGLGPWSSAPLAYDGFKPNLFTRTVMVDSGLWAPRPDLQETLDLIEVGAGDLWYKLERGYWSYSEQEGGYTGTLHIDDPDYGFQFLRSLWEDVYLPWHHGAAE